MTVGEIGVVAEINTERALPGSPVRIVEEHMGLRRGLEVTPVHEGCPLRVQRVQPAFRAVSHSNGQANARVGVVFQRKGPEVGLDCRVSGDQAQIDCQRPLRGRESSVGDTEAVDAFQADIDDIEGLPIGTHLNVAQAALADPGDTLVVILVRAAATSIADRAWHLETSGERPPPAAAGEHINCPGSLRPEGGQTFGDSGGKEAVGTSGRTVTGHKGQAIDRTKVAESRDRGGGPAGVKACQCWQAERTRACCGVVECIGKLGGGKLVGLGQTANCIAEGATGDNAGHPRSRWGGMHRQWCIQPHIVGDQPEDEQHQSHEEKH